MLRTVFKGPCRICRACGRQRDCLHACQRKLIFLIKCPCFISVCNDLLYIGCGKNFPYICRFDVFDAVVARTLDITALYHIPYGYVVLNSIYFFSSIVSGTGSSNRYASSFQKRFCLCP